jgi:hypothetical protein
MWRHRVLCCYTKRSGSAHYKRFCYNNVKERVFMKRILLAGVGFTLALSLLWVGFVNAANVRSGDSPRIMSDEVIDGTLYSTGGNIKMEGRVQGDLMCVGQNVEITGVVEGDVLCAGQNITVSGHVQGDVRIAGQNAKVTGKVDGSVTALGQSVDIEHTAAIARDVTAVGQGIAIGGSIGRDVEAIGTIFETKAKIGRDLDVTAPTITLQNTTEVSGMFMYVSEDDATIETNAKIAGKTEHKLPETQEEQAITPATYIATLVFTFSSFLMVGTALLVAAPRLVRAATTALKTSPFGTLGAGLVGIVVPPFLALVLLVSAVGVPLGIILLLGWFITLLTGVVFTGQALGQIIVAKLGWQGGMSQVAALVLGLFTLFLAALLPYLGGAIIFVAVVWGVGAVWYTVIKRRGMHGLVAEEAKK